MESVLVPANKLLHMGSLIPEFSFPSLAIRNDRKLDGGLGKSLTYVHTI